MLHCNMGEPGNKWSPTGRLSRRTFGRQAVGMALAASSIRPVRASTDFVRVGVAGLHGVGRQHLQRLLATPGVLVTAIADPDQRELDRTLAEWPAKGQRPQANRDLRHFLDSPITDAWVLATPNHWHALHAAWLMMTGQAVLLETPATHRLLEGHWLLQAWDRHQVPISCWTPWRTSRSMLQAMDHLHSGALGPIRLVRALSCRYTPGIGDVPTFQPVPPGLDYDLWCGPADAGLPKRYRLHGDWKHFWEYGDGPLGDASGYWTLDLARWALRVQRAPRRVMSFGARCGFPDDGETPNTQLVAWSFEEGVLFSEVRQLPRSPGTREPAGYRGVQEGVVIHAGNGFMVLREKDAAAYDLSGKRTHFWPADPEAPIRALGQFLEMVRKRPSAHFLMEAHRTSLLMHSANISQRMALPTSGEDLRRRLASWPDGKATLDRMQEHLAAHRLPLEQLHAGPLLFMDGQTELFAEDQRANALARPNHRREYPWPIRL